MKPLSDKRIEVLRKYYWLHDPVLAAWIVRELQELGTSVIDIGAGDGSMLPLYVDVFKRVAALDPSEAAVRSMHALHSDRSEIFLGSVEEIPLKTSEIDIAVAKSSYHHFYNPAQGLNEMLRVARKAVVLIEIVAPTSGAFRFAQKLLQLKEPSRAPSEVYTEQILRERIERPGLRTRVMFFDQYIDVKDWIDFGDIPESRGRQIMDLIDGQRCDLAEEQQIYRRSGRLVMLRRNCMVIAEKE